MNKIHQYFFLNLMIAKKIGEVFYNYIICDQWFYI